MNEMVNKSQPKYMIRAYSLKELSGMYRVSKNTFKKWLSPFQEEIGVRVGYYYSIHQVKIIFDKLGFPESPP
jgi:hypothetical protein